MYSNGTIFLIYSALQVLTFIPDRKKKFIIYNFATRVELCHIYMVKRLNKKKTAMRMKYSNVVTTLEIVNNGSHY